MPENSNKLILNANDRLGNNLRKIYNDNHNLVLNIIGGPGSGKTTLITSLIKNIGLQTAVIEADMAQDFDTQIIKTLNVPVEQINTVNSCHLNARQVAKVFRKNIQFRNAQIIFIENVGNLICPTEFFLGEHLQVIVFSVTDGDNKPLKYPVSFHKANLVIITKLDLLPYVNFDLNLAWQNIKTLNPDAQIFNVSSVIQSGINELSQTLSKKYQEMYV